MKTIKYILQKEFLQIFRNKMMLPIIFVMPIVQLLILSYTATFEIKNADIAFVDMDQSSYSRSLIGQFEGSPFFHVVGTTFSMKEAEKAMLKRKVEIVVKIPRNFERKLQNNSPASIQLIPDAVNGNAANVITSYVAQIISRFNMGIITEITQKDLSSAQINVVPRYWFNPELDYKTYMVPGILVLLVTLIGSFLSGMNIVREKEIGTIEQLNVTPIKKYQFVIGKLLPFWIIAMFDLSLGLVLAKWVFSIPILGSVGLIMGVAAIYLLLVLGLGLFISTITETQQQAMFIAWFFMVIFIMLGGLFTPAEGMPQWAQIINIANPIAHFIEFMRMVMLKGAQFVDVQWQILKITVYALLMLGLSISRYRKTS